MYKDVSKEEGTELAVKLSTQIAKEISEYVDGYYLITPFKRIDIITRIIDNIKNK
ncbi:bifunctional homocysteine S-methyltransferase/5,10-methylenetetrahydrofolate reductase protein [compost metagenome]